MPDWTPEQRAALENRGANLLVSASAGTGKTTVLVERIIRLVLDPDAPVDLDRFLVVTFTEAAASEMREKIATALRKRLGDHPGDEGLRRQTLLLDHAQISTIHSFCNRVLRQHFHVVGLDPEFTILDAEETRLVQAETADILLKEEVEKAGQELEEGPSTGRGKVLLDWLDSFRAADPIPPARDRLLRLYAFLRTLDDPTGWIHSVREAYPLDDDGQGIAALDETCEWFRAWRSELIGALENLAEQAGNLEVETARVQPKYSPWIAAYVELAEDCAEALEQEDWNEAARLLQNFSAPRMAAIRGKDPATEALQLRLYPLKELVEKTLKKDLASLRPEQAARAHADAAPSVHILLDLLESFDRLYGKAKTIRTGLDYNDLEQFCLSILRDPESPAQPSDAARAYQERFEHVLVDEYQDINHVQDAIISLVSRSLDRERPSNLFAVGDVKQSIYGFRLAAPEIFLEKYDSYRPFSAPSQPEALNDRSVRIDLTHNFRSRVEVLDTVNYFFERLMTRDSAKLDYNEDAALRPKAVFPELRSKPVPEFHLLDTKAETGDEEDAPAETDESLEPTRGEGEAMMVGRLILEAVGRNSPPGGQSVYDSALAEATRTDGLRPARFRDVVVLMRSLSSAAETYVATFNRLGIPVFVDYGAGLLATAEIRDVLNFLRLVDNPL
ncbi:UvrD-helicase domain-containing protein [bacterium]|nr:UvrD-helicase domain-containing protein [bacterium]